MSSLDMEDVKRRMEGAVSNLSSEFSGLRAGRASVAMLDTVSVDAYGSKMPLNQLSNISVITLILFENIPLLIIY